MVVIIIDISRCIRDMTCKRRSDGFKIQKSSFTLFDLVFCVIFAFWPRGDSFTPKMTKKITYNALCITLPATFMIVIDRINLS